MDIGEISLDRASQIVARAYPFRDLSRQEMKGVAAQIEEHRLARNVHGVLQRTRKAREYYIENLSMIPDEKRYNVYDIVGRRSVGTLDEAFVSASPSPGRPLSPRARSGRSQRSRRTRSRWFPSTAAARFPAGRARRFPFPSRWPRRSAGYGVRSADARLGVRGSMPAAVSYLLLGKYPLDRRGGRGAGRTH